MKFRNAEVILEAITPNATQLIERAGRTCYKSEKNISPESAEKFIKNIITSGHESVIEHASATFRVICDRGVTHEMVRHRIASYSQESTRYVNYKNKGMEFIDLNKAFPNATKEQMDIVKKSYEDSEKAYCELLESGARPDLARQVLPNGIKTEIVMTANFREWRHFIKLRTSKRAHPCIREIAEEIHNVLKGICPAVFGDIEV